MVEKTATICYFKKKMRAWVARTPEGKVFLPQDRQKLLVDGKLQKITHSMRRPKPAQNMEVLLSGKVVPDQMIEAWALKR